MTMELEPATGLLCKEDPQQIKFRNKVREWVFDKISYNEMLQHYPSYLLGIPERLVRSIREAISGQ